ncbi:MAG TPA: glycosyltransferase [Rhizomicrobium sp.]|jgi:tetratricopeptide (TPR) repeat protein|nr:glycosyltransferase [Rhizomicrobium sp.]
MSGNYRGVVKVTGSAIRGWLLDVARPARRVKFNLLIDGQLRGSYVADARRRFLSPRKGSDEDTHGFSIPIRRPWISGALQNVRLEDPHDPQLRFSMSVRLGPKAHEHFEDHVVSGHGSIGTADRAPSARRPAQPADDEPETEIRPGANKALLKQIGALGDAELAGLLFAVDRDILLQRFSRYEKTGDWERLAAFKRVVIGAPVEQLLTSFGRSAAKAHNHALAARVTAAAAAMHPQSFEANYLAGSAKALQGEFDEALRYLRVADRLEQDGARAKREMAVTLAKQLRQDLPVERRAAIREEHVALLRALSASSDIGTQTKYRVPYAAALYSAGRYEEAIQAADAVLAAAPNDTRALMVKARALVARNLVGEAHALYERILDLEPTHRGARANLRILTALVEDETGDTERVSAVAAPRLDKARHASFPDALGGLPHSWICTVGGGEDLSMFTPQLAAAAAQRVGCVELRDAGGRIAEFWRKDALAGLAESGLLGSLDDRAALERWKPFYLARGTGDAPRRPGLAVLTSRNGADHYGGGEHFLEDAAEHHVRQGYDVVILGTRPELEGRESMVNGRRAVFVGEQPAHLRRFVLENGVSLVHAISGMGFAAAEALNFTNIAFVYGVHFWNELLGDPERSEYFDDVSGGALIRREFQVILSRATAIYANSRFTQKIIEDGFGVRCPVLYAVPRERA